jgi:hypothetical protein
VRLDCPKSDIGRCYILAAWQSLPQKPVVMQLQVCRSAQQPLVADGSISLLPYPSFASVFIIYHHLGF